MHRDHTPHPWVGRVDVTFMHPCCGVPIQMTIGRVVLNLSEAVEDQYVRAAGDLVRATFAAARDRESAQHRLDMLGP